MPWPDFTELTFGYAYLRELERRNAAGGAFPLAPNFISQADLGRLLRGKPIEQQASILAYVTLDALLVLIREV